MRRRDFIKVITVSGAAWVTGASAQQTEPVRRIGVLMHVTEKDQDGQARLAAFVGRLKELGWAPKVATCTWIFAGVPTTRAVTPAKQPNWLQ
jgi:hypothetical protein